MDFCLYGAQLKMSKPHEGRLRFFENFIRVLEIYAETAKTV